LDNLSPDLKQTRANWRAIANSADAFDQGEKALLLPTHKFQEKISKFFDSSGNILPDQMANVEAFRSGIASSLKVMGEKTATTRTGQIMKLADMEGFTQAQRQNLELIYPKTKLENIIKKINQTRKTILAEGKIVHGPKTAHALGEKTQVGKNVMDTGKLLTRVTIALSGGVVDTNGIKGLFAKLSPKRAQAIPDDDMIKIAKILISEDAELVKKALTNPIAREKLLRKIDAVGWALQSGIQRAVPEIVQENLSNVNPDLSRIGSIVSPAFSEEISPSDYRYVKDLAGSVKPETKDKILKITIRPIQYKMPDGSIVPVEQLR